MSQRTSLSPTSGAGRLGFTEKVGYALGDAASNLFFQTFMLFLMFYYTDIYGMPAAAVGTMFLVTRVWDAVNDPLMGLVADRTRTRWGRFRPYLLWFAGPLAASGVALFTSPDLQGTSRLLYAYATYTLAMMLYTAINIPYGALMGVMTPSSQERTSLSSFRFIGAFTAAVFVQKFTTDLVTILGAGDAARGYQWTMALYGIIAATMFVATFVSTRERVAPAEEKATSPARDLADLAGNRPWMVMLLLGLLVLVAFSLRGGVTIYYLKYVVGREDLTGWFLASGGVANVLGVALTAPLTRRLGKKTLYLSCMAAGAVTTALFFVVDPTSITLLFALQALSNGVLGPTAPLVWAMYADTADYSEWRTGRRATGLVFSAATFSQKLGGALGGYCLGIFLTAFGYAPNSAQSPTSLLGIVLLMSIIPAGFMLIAVIAASLYELDEGRMASVEADLAARRRESPRSEPPVWSDAETTAA